MRGEENKQFWDVDFPYADEFLITSKEDRFKNDDWAALSKDGALWHRNEDFRFI